MMAGPGCIKCFDTPCTCGYAWESYPLTYLIGIRKSLDLAIDSKTAKLRKRLRKPTGPSDEKSG